MVSSFPRVVVIDNDKHHHYAVWVNRAQDTIAAMCVDCADVVEVPGRMVEKLKDLLRNDDDVQVIAWIEEYGN